MKVNMNTMAVVVDYRVVAAKNMVLSAYIQFILIDRGVEEAISMVGYYSRIGTRAARQLFK